MKIRSGFVSNSSSSSFIVIDKSSNMVNLILDDNRELLIPNSLGIIEFGWQVEEYNDFFSKLNFAFRQVLYLNKDSYEIPPSKENIEAYNAFVLFDSTLRKHNINPKYVITEEEAKKLGTSVWADDDYYYIDHQSNAKEGKNLEMFESAQAMEDFLFRPGSYIQCDNDN